MELEAKIARTKAKLEALQREEMSDAELNELYDELHLEAPNRAPSASSEWLEALPQEAN